MKRLSKRHGNKVYFAGPMFNQAEKEYNLKITKLLEEFGYQVFLPQRDGIEARLSGLFTPARRDRSGETGGQDRGRTH